MVEVGGSMVEVGCGESTTRASYGAQMHQINKLWGASASRCGAMMHGQERDSISVLNSGPVTYVNRSSPDGLVCFETSRESQLMAEHEYTTSL